MIVAEIGLNYFGSINIPIKYVSTLCKSNIAKILSTGVVSDTKEVGEFVSYIIKNNIRQLSGNTIFFDVNQSKFIY